MSPDNDEDITLDLDITLCGTLAARDLKRVGSVAEMSEGVSPEAVLGFCGWGMSSDML